MVKHCNSCNRTLSIQHFSKCKRDDYQSKCKECKTQYQKENRAKKLIWQETYRTNNKEILKEKRKEYYYSNIEQEKQRKKNWCSKNKNKLRAGYAKRRAQKLKATPPWLTETHFQQINIFYDAATKLTKELNTEFHVDHIVPLQGKNVSGLHVPWNLQVLLKEENLRKGNK